MKKQKKIILIAAITVLLCIVTSLLMIIKFNSFHLELNLTDDATTLEYGDTDLPQVSAVCKGTFLYKEGKEVKTTLSGEVDTQKLGTYEVEYTAKIWGLKLTEKHTYIIQDTQAPVIELVTDPEHITSPIAQYEEEGFKATDNYDGDITNLVSRVEKDGIVIYTVADSSGNETTVERKIIYKDVVAPTIELTDGQEITWNVGTEYEDPGYVATDDVDGDLSKKVSVEGTVDTETQGEYQLTYHVEDSSGNLFSIERKVVVKDLKAPKLKLKGDKTFYVLLGSDYDEPGYSASDNVDGKLTSKVKVKGKVNTNKVGRYKKTYTVTDEAGNITQKTRTVFVYKKQSIVDTINPGDKIVYLTFDDGPSKYTDDLLDILDKYGVKATFFVTDQYPKYRDMIGETARRGHTIALHTYKHDYSKVYKDLDAYFKDLEKIQKVVVKQTGKEATLVRFPGGTSNMISKKYCPGIMTDIVDMLPLYGYQYCDWNVDSGDAGGTRTISGVYNNVISGISNHNVSYVLQHDTTSYSVNAVEHILAWGIANGYTFLPLTESSPLCHHPVNN